MDELLNNVLIGMPEGTANLQLPDPELRDYYRDEQDRIFWVESPIDENLLSLVKMIMRCNREDKDILDNILYSGVWVEYLVVMFSRCTRQLKQLK